ncbi:MAG: inositol monophosphatase family protein [Acidimicrobiia bacterium]
MTLSPADPGGIVACFERTADAVLAAVNTIAVEELHRDGERPTQYALDLVADDAALRELHPTGVRVRSEESGWTGPEGAAITVVVDPVDGSTNCARQIPMWAISLAAVDEQGLLVGYVRNQVVGTTWCAVRGAGATRNGVPVQPNRSVDAAHVIVGHEGPFLFDERWWQTRSLGSAALGLCAVASGELDAYVLPFGVSPWDYLAGVLVCQEAGVPVVDAAGGDVTAVEPDARCFPYAAVTQDLLSQLVETFRS